LPDATRALRPLAKNRRALCEGPEAIGGTRVRVQSAIGEPKITWTRRLNQASRELGEAVYVLKPSSR